MPKIQVFVSKPILDDINNIVNEKINEGADRSEANISQTTAMLTELGLRVYKLQQDKKSEEFSQEEFNKIMLENMMKTSFVCQKLLGINSFNAEIQNMDKFNFQTMASQIKEDVNDVMAHYFPDEEDNR